MTSIELVQTSLTVKKFNYIIWDI